MIYSSVRKSLFTTLFKNKKAVLFLVAIYLVGLYPRLSGLDGGFAFTFDQGRDFLTLSKIVNEHKLQLIGPPTGPIDGVFHGVWWFWFLAPFFYLVKGNPEQLVTIYNISSTLIIFLFFYICNTIKNRVCGIIGAFFIAISPTFIRYSSQIWHPNIVPIAMLGLFLTVLLYLKKCSPFFMIGILLGVIFEFHIGFGTFFVPAFLIALLLSGIRPTSKEIALGIGGFIFWAIPRLIFDMRHDFLQLKSVVNYIHWSPGRSKGFIDQFTSTGQLFLGIFTDLTANGNKMLGGLYVFLTILVLKKYWATYSKFTTIFIKLIIFTILILFCELLFFPGQIWNHYLIGLPALFLIPFIVCLNSVIERFKVFGVLLVGVYMIIIWEPWRLMIPPWEGDSSVFRNQLAAVQEIFDHTTGKPFNVQVYSPALIDYQYQYLFLWLGTRKYEQVPDREHVTSQVFLVVEPNPLYPDRRLNWLKERDGDGKNVWNKKFTGNIYVEQRAR